MLNFLLTLRKVKIGLKRKFVKLDELNNDALTNEFSVAISNKRGLIVKSIFEGGNEEIIFAEDNKLPYIF